MRPQTTGELFEDGADDDAAINPYDDLDASLVARGPLVELEEDDSNFQVGWGVIGGGGGCMCPVGFKGPSWVSRFTRHFVK